MFSLLAEWHQLLPESVDHSIKVVDHDSDDSAGGLLEPGTLAYITKAVEREVKKAESATPKDGAATTKRLGQERRRLQRWAEGRWAGARREAALIRCGSPGYNPRTPK